MATPTIASAPPSTQDRPEVLRRPLGFPVGEGAPGPVALVLGTDEEAEALTEIATRLGAVGLVARPAPGLGSRGQQLAAAVAALDATFAEHRPSCVVVQGDSTVALAGALAANTAGLPLVHLGAGLRSFDRRVPDEHHRVTIDHLADLCCAASPTAVANLRAEGVADERILLTGTTVVETARHTLPDEDAQDRILTGLGVSGDYLLLDVRRPENTENPDVLRQVLRELQDVAAEGLRVVAAVDPGTLDRLHGNGLDHLLEAFTVIAPPPPAEFLTLLQRARLVVADSGAVQEQVSVLGKRLLLVRRATEHPEVVGSFASLVSGGLRLGAAVRAALAEDPRALLELPSPYGDGSASRVLVESVVKLVAPF